mgnify:CR=1 FL=1
MYKRQVYYILLAVFIGVFLFAAYQIGSYMLEKHKSDEVLKDAGKYVYIPDLSSDEEPEGEPEQVYVDFAALEGVNSDIVAWLYGADTGLNYPIVQAEDNDYYLYRLLDGTWNKNGTIFMDYVNRSDFSDQNTLVYGHHMKSGAMFGALVQYKKQEFYDAHPYLYLYTPQQSYRLDLIAGSVVDYDDAGSIGKRYRRQDEVGTPYCITVDFETVGDENTPADHCVTIRERDTMEQVRIPISEVKSFLEEKVKF